MTFGSNPSAILFDDSVETLFWMFLGCVAYAYVGYPVVLWATSPLVARFTTRKPPSSGGGSVPAAVTIVVPSYNEAAVLGQRLHNLLGLRFPPAKLEIIVGSDASTDHTASIAGSMPDRRVRFVSVPRRGGKTALLNAMIAQAAGEIIVFTDANSHFEPDALQHLIAPFSDPRVGCVTGELVYVNAHEPAVRAGEGLYWRLENAIKDLEGRFGGTLVATGAIYAMRRELCVMLPAGISDDSVNPLLALAAGYRVIVEKRARAHERAAATLGEEFGRKHRMVTRQLAAHAKVGYFLKPFHPVLAFRLASHKLLRWLVPFFLLGALVANLALTDRLFYRFTLIGAVIGVLLFVVGLVADKRAVPIPNVVRTWVYFGVVNIAAFRGVLDFLRGRQRVIWSASPSTRYGR